ncbi:hypothetical protein AB0L05_41025 [Nonomuraea pusilla]|uniref:hypothetical protein n=1 Tax=Nonomuraea pusilla TaxID=46177 RepID=UPI00331BD53C
MVADPIKSVTVETPASVPSPSVIDAAKAKAKQSGREVESPSLNTENMTTVARPDGKAVGTYTYLTPIRFKNSAGDWQQIDTTLVKDGDFVRPKSVKADVRLSAGGDTTLMSLKADQGDVQVSAPAKLPHPVLSGNTATYANAYGHGLDLEIQTTLAGIRQKIVIRQRPSGPLTFRVPIRASRGLEYREKANRVEVLDDSKKIADIIPALMLDAKASQSITQGRFSSVDTKLDGSTLVYSPDAAFLADPGTTYPVTLAGNPTPWYGAGFPSDTFISNDSRFTVGGAQQYMDAIIAGRNNFDGATSTYYIYRSYLRYDLTGAPWYGLPIINADVRPWNYITTHCGGAEQTPEMVVRRVISDWALNEVISEK